MSTTKSLARLQALGRNAVTTEEAASVLAQTPGAANKTLTRLAASGLIRKIRQGTWWVTHVPIHPFALIGTLTAPYPSYISFHSALRHYGMIEQIPAVTTVATLGRTRCV